MKRPFRFSLPRITTPVDRGAKPAIVLGVKLTEPQATFVFVTAMDIDGQIHADMPIMKQTMMAASQNPINFIEVDPHTQEAPSAIIIP